MKRRRLLQAVATAGAAGAAGCVSVRLANEGDRSDGGDGGTQSDTPDVPDNFGLNLCSEDDAAIYELSEPTYEIGDEATRFTGTITYVGEDPNQFAVTVDLVIVYFDEEGERIDQEVKTLRFAPSDPNEFLVTVNSRDSSGWDQIEAFTVEIRDGTEGGDGEDGCLVDEFADPASGA